METSEWIYFPLGLLALLLFVSTLTLWSKSEKADEAGVPRTRTLSISAGVVKAAWIITPLMRIFQLDDGIWLWIGRTLGIAFLVAMPVWVREEARRGTIEPRWTKTRPARPSPE